MARKAPQARITSYGIYTPFDRTGKQLPHVLEFTTDVPAQVGTEFGYVLEITKAQGELLMFRIDHPDFPDADGEPAPPFTGQQRVRTSPYTFFLGDCIWAPAADKVGDWTLTTWIAEKQVARKTFHVTAESPPPNAGRR